MPVSGEPGEPDARERRQNCRPLRHRRIPERDRRRAGDDRHAARAPAFARLLLVLGGGSGGIGSINYGGLREPGNILAARVVTVEETPRVIELRTDAAQKVNRAYGTTGIITALEMPLAPAWPWVDLIVAFDDFAAAMQVGYEVALADGVVKKLITPMIWPIPQHFSALRARCPEGKHVIFCMIAEPSLESFKDIVGKRGTITYEQPHDDSAGKEPRYEY